MDLFDNAFTPSQILAAYLLSAQSNSHQNPMNHLMQHDTSSTPLPLGEIDIYAEIAQLPAPSVKMVQEDLAARINGYLGTISHRIAYHKKPMQILDAQGQFVDTILSEFDFRLAILSSAPWRSEFYTNLAREFQSYVMGASEALTNKIGCQLRVEGDGSIALYFVGKK